MSIFYVNQEKSIDGSEFFDKYDFAKFIDGKSDVPEETKTRVRLAISGNSEEINAYKELLEKYNKLLKDYNDLLANYNSLINNEE